MTEPIAIFDLRRKTKQVQLNGEDNSLQVVGLTALQICDHLERFPQLAAISTGGSMPPIEMIKAVPGVTQAWVASALGHHNSDWKEQGQSDAEKAVSENLTAEDTSFIIQESLGLTFSRGFGPFLGRIGVLAQYLTVAPGKGQDMRSPTRSPPPPPPPARSPTGLGIIHPDSSQPSSSSQSEDASSELPETSAPPPSVPEESQRPLENASVT